MRFGEKLKFELERRDIKQKDFAKTLNVSASTLCGYINTNRQPDFDLVRKIASELDVSVDYLLDVEPKPAGTALSKNEIKLINGFRGLTTEEQQIILRFVELLNGKRQ